MSSPYGCVYNTITSTQLYLLFQTPQIHTFWCRLCEESTASSHLPALALLPGKRSGYYLSAKKPLPASHASMHVCIMRTKACYKATKSTVFLIWQYLPPRRDSQLGPRRWQDGQGRAGRMWQGCHVTDAVSCTWSSSHGPHWPVKVGFARRNSIHSQTRPGPDSYTIQPTIVQVTFCVVCNICTKAENEWL